MVFYVFLWKLLRPIPVAMVTKICKFQHKNGYNSGCIRHNPDTCIT